MKNMGFIGACLLTLSSCVSAPPPPAICAPVKTWSKAEQHEILLSEMMLTEGNILIAVLQDYSRMRDQDRIK